MNYKTILPFLFALFSLSINAQQVNNVRFEQKGKKINIYYDLQGDGNYTVKVYCREDSGKNWGQSLKKVTGAVDKNQQAGANKLIVWDVLQEREKLSGDILFKVEVHNDYSLEMVFVKGSTFQMGSNNGDNNEKPVHTVTVDDFYIGKYEVTQRQWKEIMGSNPSYFKGDNLPVERVSWNDVQKFIKKLNEKTGQNYRLPTEAEWEFAARGGNKSRGYKYSGNSNINKVAWYGYEKSGKKTHAVGTKQANELGIYDMNGNVWEWCSDWYDSNYYKNSSNRNPKGPSSSKYRVLRGGSWYSSDYDCRVTIRSGYYSNYAYGYSGFRLVH